MDTKNPSTEEALQRVAAIESAIATYQSAKTNAAEEANHLEEAKQAENAILAEADSDIVDAAERLLIAGAVVRVLTARADAAKPQAALKALGEIVVASEGFLHGTSRNLERTRLAEEIKCLCETVGLTPNRAPKSLTDTARRHPRVVESARIAPVSELVSIASYSRGIADEGTILNHAARAIDKLRKLAELKD
jgi:hypothetical protein